MSYRGCESLVLMLSRIDGRWLCIVLSLLEPKVVAIVEDEGRGYVVFRLGAARVRMC